MVHQLLQEVPLHVEDYPSDEVQEQFGLEYIDELCGLHTGIALKDRSILDSGHLPNVVTIYREGILSAAVDTEGCIRSEELRRQIRITILHELGHHCGLTEEELKSLGYE